MNGQNTEGIVKRSFMMRSAFAQLPIFVAVAERLNFTAAARLLGISASAVSQAVERLEREIGQPLLIRTTRSVHLTEAGTRLLERATIAVSAGAQALAVARTSEAQTSGVLRLNVPRIACCVGLPGLLARYARENPRVRSDIVVDDRRIDIVKGGFDVGIRSRESVRKDMAIARMTAPIRFVVVGSPAYFARHGRPSRPRDLVRHACLGWKPLSGESRYRWEFRNGARELDVAVSGPIVSNDSALLAQCAAEGLGLAFVTADEVALALRTGLLETVLDAYATESDGLFLYYPRSARKQPNLAAFIACARDHFASVATNITARP